MGAGVLQLEKKGLHAGNLTHRVQHSSRLYIYKMCVCVCVLPRSFSLVIFPHYTSRKTGVNQSDHRLSADIYWTDSRVDIVR